MDSQTLLALYRTRLAEQRTALSFLQLGILLVTVPLTIHAALLLLSQQHPGAARVHTLMPLWLALGALVPVGVALSAWAGGRLLKAARSGAALRRTIAERSGQME